jgi:hypothetical protein
MAHQTSFSVGTGDSFPWILAAALNSWPLTSVQSSLRMLASYRHVLAAALASWPLTSVQSSLRMLASYRHILAAALASWPLTSVQSSLLMLASYRRILAAALASWPLTFVQCRVCVCLPLIGTFSLYVKHFFSRICSFVILPCNILVLISVHIHIHFSQYVLGDREITEPLFNVCFYRSKW